MTKPSLDAVAIPKWIGLAPTLMKRAPARRILRAVTGHLVRVGDDGSQHTITTIRKKYVALAKGTRADTAPALVFCVNVLCDLTSQGWCLQVRRRGIFAQPPAAPGDNVSDEKARVRRAHLIERDAQLSQPSVRAFVEDMERRRPWRGHWRSIFSLMREGRELNRHLAQAVALSGAERSEALRAAIDPYVQPAVAGRKCKFTGLDLLDVWRYFRHTWTTVYQSTPGRKLFFLVRDRAAVNHPVIGIGALGSPIMQLSVRDVWIGWTGDQVVSAMLERPTDKWASWVGNSLRQLLASIYTSDLVKQRRLTKAQLTRPDMRAIARLRSLAASERKLHQLFPSAHQHKVATKPGTRVNWKSQAHTHLFRSKRAAALADLLEARRNLQVAGFSGRPTGASCKALASAGARRAIATIVRYMKAAHAGIDMMDITVCGAVAPYNRLLGGKLVSLLMTSPEITREYARRYASTPSLIASSMAAKRVCRKPRLVLLGTTSLYGVGASKYHRLRLPVHEAESHCTTELTFARLGSTAGYGSYHFSQDTMLSLEPVLSQLQRGRQVNSIFGEGVNPKLRKVRGALDAVGLPSDLLMQHGSPRIVYGVALATNFREVLLGAALRPAYILPQSRRSTTIIVNHWYDRWLTKRIEIPEVLADVERHQLTYPITHGARVTLPATDGTVSPPSVRIPTVATETQPSLAEIVSFRTIPAMSRSGSRRPLSASTPDVARNSLRISSAG
jgi:hypothetical protein